MYCLFNFEVESKMFLKIDETSLNCVHTQENTIWGVMNRYSLCIVFAFSKQTHRTIFCVISFLNRWVFNKKKKAWTFDLENTGTLNCHHENFSIVCDFSKRICNDFGFSFPRAFPETQLYVFFVDFKLFSLLIWFFLHVNQCNI